MILNRVSVIRAITYKTSFPINKVGYNNTTRFVKMWSKNQTPPHLPIAKGPYTPGCVDVMLDYSENGTFMRLFYPTNLKSNEENCSKWIPWFSDSNYLAGIARSLMVNPRIFKFVHWLYSSQGFYVPALYGENINVDNKLKCIVFSHGYANSRFSHTIICNELASRGYLVAAIEHKDRSGGYTYYYKSKSDAELDIKTAIDVKIIKFGQGHYEARNQQVNQRANECTKLLDILIDINNGNVPHNIFDDVQERHKQIPFKLKNLVGKLDLDNVSIAGHSFGGATAALALFQRPEFKQAILLDPWMYPVKSEKCTLENPAKPLLFINTQTFHNVANAKAMEKFYARHEENEMYTILHTTHESQTDMVYVMGHWLNLFMKKLPPLTALTINNALILKFLKKHTKHDENIDNMISILESEDVNITNGLTKPWC